MATPTEQKAVYRHDILTRRNLLSKAAHAFASEQICQKIRQLPQYQTATSIAGFAPMTEEVNIWPLLEESRQAGKTVVLPRVIDKKKRLLGFYVYRGSEFLQPGFSGILEPPLEEKKFSAQCVDFLLVPAVAIDKNKKRLGYGGGFYDKVLFTYSYFCSCAPIFRCQLTDILPCEEHDQSVQLIITE